MSTLSSASTWRRACNTAPEARGLDASLEQYVEQGTAPSAIIGSKFEGQDRLHAMMTRPLCPYPKAAKYKGSGDPNDAANFECQRKE